MKKNLILICLIISISSFAKERTKNSFWAGVFSKKELTTEYSWWSEAQLRYSFDQGGVGQFLYRTGALYTIDNDHGIGLLYGYITTGEVKEHRWTFQHTQTYSNSESSKLSSRTRLEYRNNENSDDDSWRFRYLFRFDKNEGVYWNEVFLNLTDEKNANHQIFERNRLFIGSSAEVFNSKIEYGYLNQYVPRDNSSVIEHIATIYFFM